MENAPSVDEVQGLQKLSRNINAVLNWKLASSLGRSVDNIIQCWSITQLHDDVDFPFGLELTVNSDYLFIAKHELGIYLPDNPVQIIVLFGWLNRNDF